MRINAKNNARSGKVVEHHVDNLHAGARPNWVQDEDLFSPFFFFVDPFSSIQKYPDGAVDFMYAKDSRDFVGIGQCTTTHHPRTQHVSGKHRTCQP